MPSVMFQKFQVRPQTETNKSPGSLLASVSRQVMQWVKLKAAVVGLQDTGQEASSCAPSPHTLTPPPLEGFIETQLSLAVWSAKGEKNQPGRKLSIKSMIMTM